tara:strand:+ start:1060 stop:2976 length:1917 start_codon:yes stop_codon:yes gene_type:complete
MAEWRNPDFDPYSLNLFNRPKGFGQPQGGGYDALMRLLPYLGAGLMQAGGPHRFQDLGARSQAIPRALMGYQASERQRTQDAELKRLRDAQIELLQGKIRKGAAETTALTEYNAMTPPASPYGATQARSPENQQIAQAAFNYGQPAGLMGNQPPPGLGSQAFAAGALARPAPQGYVPPTKEQIAYSRAGVRAGYTQEVADRRAGIVSPIDQSRIATMRRNAELHPGKVAAQSFAANRESRAAAAQPHILSGYAREEELHPGRLTAQAEARVEAERKRMKFPYELRGLGTKALSDEEKLRQAKIMNPLEARRAGQVFDWTEEQRRFAANRDMRAGWEDDRASKRMVYAADRNKRVRQLLDFAVYKEAREKGASVRAAELHSLNVAKMHRAANKQTPLQEKIDLYKTLTNEDGTAVTSAQAAKLALGVITPLSNQISGRIELVDTLTRKAASAQYPADFNPEEIARYKRMSERGMTLWEMREGVTGLWASAKEFWADTIGQIPGVPVDAETVTRRTMYEAANEDLINASRRNARYTEVEANRLGKIAKIDPSAFRSQQTLEARMRMVDLNLTRRLMNEIRTSRDPNTNAVKARKAADAATTIENFLRWLGVPPRGAGATQGGNRPLLGKPSADIGRGLLK